MEGDGQRKYRKHTHSESYLMGKVWAILAYPLDPAWTRTYHLHPLWMEPLGKAHM